MSNTLVKYKTLRQPINQLVYKITLRLKNIMDNKNFNVIISNTEDSNQAIAAKLASLFKISLDKATGILQKDEFIIKKQTDKKTAEKFHKAISAAGANCRIEEIATEEDIALPTIEELAPTADAKPLIDPTKPDIAPLHGEQVNLGLVDRPLEKPKSETGEEKVFDDIDPANYCPECGTIRASTDSVCVHCGYDPELINKGKARSTIIKAVAGFIVLVAIILIALPFYQQFAKQMKVEEDLKLAFDTRNKVTEFIKQTNFWPNQNIDARLPKKISNQSVKSVVIGDNAIITVTLRAQALDGDEQTLIFTPNTLKGHIVWNCIKGSLDEKYRPEICRQREIIE